MQVLFESRHPQGAQLRDLAFERVRGSRVHRRAGHVLVASVGQWGLHSKILRIDFAGDDRVAR